ncbi:MAG: chemotaxis protein MotB [Roseibaca calidilacus]|uniref:Chemotaxis protein MotB n=1 Tax=Roseibaca calidilacus TaxID=1666912 RepID=A0A0P7W6B1_9RHOB|nr:OmpA family protein [Roseibaca calidilacus]KPP95558.1 MAG: chemotaxis protein MotB [Roseibaca calidilacus]CUX82094.1 chemotaxis protein MotB [Roseibaca calidilacus]
MAAKTKSQKVVPIFVEDDDDDEPDCPKCPPVGAPAWMATFADLATLLMAFFVLILAFANFDEVSFKKMTGALREHFGENIVEILPNPESSTVLEMDFKPASNPASPSDSPDPQEAAGPEAEALQALADTLREALEQGEMTVSNENGMVSVRLPEGTGAQDLAQALANTAQEFAGMGPKPESGATGDQAGQGTQPQEDAAPGDTGRSSEARAAIADARLRVALRQLQAQGLVDVERDENKVKVTVGAGGAFPSGSADLTAQARDIMARIAQASVGDGANVTVTGHTDSVPLSGGPFRDNWGLAAARASSVVRELGANGTIEPGRMLAASRGEADPVASNATAQGREANRRIEILFEYGSGDGG